MKENKILILGITPPEEGGSQRHIYELAKRINSVKVLTQRNSLCRNKIELPVINVSVLLRNITFFIACFIYSFKLLAVKKYDIIHIHENLLYLLVPILRLRYKVIVTVHGLSGFNFYDNKYLWFFFKIGLRSADKIIAVSKSDKKLLEKLSSRVVYVPNGVDLTAYSGIKVKVEKKISFIGRIHKQKGIIYLIEAFNKISANNPNYKLEIIGEINGYAKELQNKFNNNNIIWRGYVSDRRTIAKYLKSSYCIVLPSLWEGLPLTLFESLASSRPVIVSEIQAFKDVVEKEVLFFRTKSVDDLANKISFLIKNSKKAANIGRKGLITSRDYEWKEIAKKTLEEYKI